MGAPAEITARRRSETLEASFIDGLEAELGAGEDAPPPGLAVEAAPRGLFSVSITWLWA